MKKYIKAIIFAIVITVLMISVIMIYSCTSKDNADPTPTTPVPSTAKTESTPPETEAVDKPPFVSKKDFASLKEQYPHAFAWIEIPGTYIDYPVIMHPEDDTYYLRRDEAGNYSVNGCVFAEHRYNANDFSDPITLLYGHYVIEYDGFKYFGGLQSTYKDDLETCKEIIIYHPDKELHYEVFAAVRYNSYHILHGTDFSKADNFNGFISGLKGIKGVDATVDTDYDVKAGDKLLVLSTCYNGNTDRRFLVVAKLVEEIN